MTVRRVGPSRARHGPHRASQARLPPGWSRKSTATGCFWQCDAVEAILERFGAGYVYENHHGHMAINAEVLAAFRELTGDRVVWSRGGKYWRLRDEDDEPGRGQR